jgi:dolichyl-phosphate-mannose--protein O-mannosyl transferase
VVFPALVYGVQWLPHLGLMPQVPPWELFQQIHGQIWVFHRTLGEASTAPVHPYCSPWWSWPALWRPIAYFFQEGADGRYQAIYAMGNPILHWGGFGAIVGLWTWRSPLPRHFLYLSFIGHWLPWALSSRCTFLYHYMPAAVFAMIAFAGLLDRFWHRGVWAPATLGIVVLAFLWWLPIYTGYPISAIHFRMLMWFANWI